MARASLCPSLELGVDVLRTGVEDKEDESGKKLVCTGRSILR